MTKPEAIKKPDPKEVEKDNKQNIKSLRKANQEIKQMMKEQK